MCVILYCPPNKAIKTQYLHNAFFNNPDGAGIMYYDYDGKVNYQKGFMTVKDMEDFWLSLDERLPRAVHCRIATSGAVTPDNCHPYVISNDLEEMRSLEGVSDTGCLMHNGILKEYAPTEGIQSPYSDTMIFNKEVIYPLVQDGCIDSKGVKRMMEDYDSRFLLFLPNFHAVMFGEWTLDSQGFYASNLSYSSPCYETYTCNDWENELNYYGVAIRDVVPRFRYFIEVNGGYDAVNEFVDDYGDYLININQPYKTYWIDEGGIVQFTADIFIDTDFEDVLDYKYTIIDKDVIEERY